MTLTGGPVFWFLMALAVASAVVFLERLVELRRAQIDWQDFVKGVLNVLNRGNEDEALAICDETSVPVAAVVATAIRNRARGEHRLREAVDAQGRLEIGRLNRRLAALAIIGQIAPLLGLLGTVLGFIDTVSLVNAAELVSRADLMRTAMDALVSAALGLGVAIPVAVMYGMLRTRMNRFVSDLEADATLVVNDVTAKEGA
jgi:biopolymer transport protein ExbB